MREIRRGGGGRNCSSASPNDLNKGRGKLSNIYWSRKEGGRTNSTIASEKKRGSPNARENEGGGRKISSTE